MFRAEVIGNLGADVEVKSAQGRKFATIRVADTRKWKDDKGNDHTETQWVDGIISNTDSEVLKYLKQGVKVFVRGDVQLRVYSSPKDRCMKAGAQLHVREIELCGGSSDDVPRQLIDPLSGMVLNVTKHYWVDRDNKDIKKNVQYSLIDKSNRLYLMNKEGFVTPVIEEPNSDNDHAGEESQEEQKQ